MKIVLCNMGKRYVYFLLVVIYTLPFFSCGDLSGIDVDYDGYADIKSVKGSKAIFVIPAAVGNPTGYTLKVKKVEFDIFRKGYTFATLSLSKTLKIARHTNQPYELQLQIHFKNPLIFLDDDFDFDIELEEYTLKGCIKVGVGLLSKKLEFEEMTFNQLIKRLENL